MGHLRVITQVIKHVPYYNIPILSLFSLLIFLSTKQQPLPRGESPIPVPDRARNPPPRFADQIPTPGAATSALVLEAPGYFERFFWGVCGLDRANREKTIGCSGGPCNRKAGTDLSPMFVAGGGHHQCMTTKQLSILNQLRSIVKQPDILAVSLKSLRGRHLLGYASFLECFLITGEVHSQRHGNNMG